MRCLRLKTIIAFILTMIAAVPGFSLFATVSSWNTELLSDPPALKKIEILEPGMVVNIEKENNEFYRVSYRKVKGWVRKETLVVYNNLFSNVRVKPFLSSKIFEDGGRYYLYYYMDGKLYKYNATDRVGDSVQKIRDPSAIFPSPKQELFLLEGVTTNSREEHHFQIFNFNNGKTVYLGSFPDNRFELKGIRFSPDADYMAMVFLYSYQYITIVYKTENGEIAGIAKGARNASWVNRFLILNNLDAFWFADYSGAMPEMDIGFKKENLMIRAQRSWLLSGEISSRVAGQWLYIRTSSGVIRYNLKDKKLEQTHLQSLVWNDEMNLSFILKNQSASVRQLDTGNTLPDFSGSEPKAEFVSFVRKGILGRVKTEKIETIVLFDYEGKEVYRYRAIDEPAAISPDGVIAEINTDKDLSVLTIENPIQKNFYFVFTKEQK